MEKQNDERFVEVVIESYALRNKEGVGLYRTSTRECAERQLNSFREYYEQHSLPFNSRITRERAIVVCEVVRRRYPKNHPDPNRAGKTLYRLYHNDDFVTMLDHKPKPMDLINACVYDVEWKVIE